MSVVYQECKSILMPMHQNRYVGFFWPEDIQPHEAAFMAELFALQVPAIKAIAERNVAQEVAEAEYQSWADSFAASSSGETK